MTCSKFSSKGLAAFDSLRSTGSQLEQTTPPAGPLNTMSDMLFSHDESVLYTLIKGNMTANQPGNVAVYGVSQDEVSTTPQPNVGLNGTAVLFGTVKVPGSSALFATDASFGTTVLDMQGGQAGQVLRASEVTAIADQKATCWSTISHSTKTAFVTDVLVNHLVEIDPQKGGIIREYNLTNGNTGMIDLKAKGNFVYALAPSANATSAVVVFDVSQGKGKAQQIQNFGLPSSVTRVVQGMAVYA